MTLNELRTLVFGNVGVRMEQDVLPDSNLIISWDQAVDFWLRYKRPFGGADFIGFEVDESLTHEFKDVIPSKINVLYRLPNGVEVPCWMYWYVKPHLYLKEPMLPGKYAVRYSKAMDYESLSPRDLPVHFLRLFSAYVKRQVGQFMKFANYLDAPFGGDAEAWYREGDQTAKETEDFIMVNRDEWDETLTDFNFRRGALPDSLVSDSRSNIHVDNTPGDGGAVGGDLWEFQPIG